MSQCLGQLYSSAVQPLASVHKIHYNPDPKSNLWLALASLSLWAHGCTPRAVAPLEARRRAAPHRNSSLGVLYAIRHACCIAGTVGLCPAMSVKYAAFHTSSKATQALRGPHQSCNFGVACARHVDCPFAMRCAAPFRRYSTRIQDKRPRWCGSTEIFVWRPREGAV